MRYGEAAERASEFGVRLPIQPEGWVCPQYAPCPPVGKPADARGWLIIVHGLLGPLINPQVDGYLVWIGEDGGTITSDIWE
jgi:hypothetical protein